MDFSEFLKKLATGKGEFQTSGKLYAKNGNVEMCPLTYVCYKEKGVFYGISDYNVAAKDLGLPAQLALDISLAADKSFFEENETGKIRKELRTKMIEVLS